MVSLGSVDNSYSNSEVFTQGWNRASRGLMHYLQVEEAVAQLAVALTFVHP